MFKIFTAISGGVTGNRESYVKNKGGQVMLFDTQEEAQQYADLLKRNRSPHAGFHQRWEVVPHED